MKFTEHLIGYFDILGYKELIKNGISIEELTEGILKTAELFSEIPKDTFGIKIHPKTYMFSDNFCMCIDISGENKRYYSAYRAYFILLFGAIQFFLYIKYNISIRGAITIGDINSENSVIIGDGIIKVTDLEKYEAIYTRIIITDDVIKLGEDDIKLTFPIPKSTLSEKYFDFLSQQFILSEYFSGDSKRIQMLNFIRYCNPYDIVNFYITKSINKFSPVDQILDKMRNAYGIDIYNIGKYADIFCKYTIENLRNYKDNNYLLTKYLNYVVMGHLYFNEDRHTPKNPKYTFEYLESELKIPFTQIYNDTKHKVQTFSGDKNSNEYKNLQNYYRILSAIPDSL
jgi:hypothetical protein